MNLCNQSLDSLFWLLVKLKTWKKLHCLLLACIARLWVLITYWTVVVRIIHLVVFLKSLLAFANLSHTAGNYIVHYLISFFFSFKTGKC